MLNKAVSRILLLSAALLTLGTFQSPSASAVTLYSVRPKDTLTTIARDHHVTVEGLKKINKDLRKSESVRVGQILMIPDADESGDGGSQMAVHSYQIINPSRPAPVKSTAVKAPADAKVAVKPQADARTPVADAKPQPVALQSPQASSKPAAEAPKVVESPKAVAVLAPQASSDKPVVAAAADATPAPVAHVDTAVIIEGDGNTVTEPSVTHVPLQDNIAIIDSQIIRVPSYKAPEAPSRAGTDEHHPMQLASRKGSIIASILTLARHFMGVPYVWGGTTPSGFDCSGFVQRVFALNGIHLPRLADAQYYQGRPVKNPSPGDLVFFSTYLPGPSHVGIYLGGNQFIHASSHRGVTVSSLTETFYAKAYIGARSYF